MRMYIIVCIYVLKFCPCNMVISLDKASLAIILCISLVCMYGSKVN